MANDSGIDVERDARAFEGAFRARHPWAWAATLFGPFVLSLAVLATIALARGIDHAERLLVAAGLGFAFFGRFLILAGRDPEFAAAHGGLSAEELVALVVYLDVATAVLVVFHMGVLFRLPWLGRWLFTLIEDGRGLLAGRRSARRWTFVATVAFVMFPLASTGSVGGSILGRLLGMGRASTLLAIGCGSGIGCGLMYFGAAGIERYLDRDSPVLKIGGVVLIAALIVFLHVRYRRAVRGRGRVNDRS